uniref:Histone deacetylase n=1 Tax=Trichogramma kaykai TaxID=54128 RepID=A0ABD2W3X1_9HYME
MRVSVERGVGGHHHTSAFSPYISRSLSGSSNSSNESDAGMLLVGPQPLPATPASSSSSASRSYAKIIKLSPTSLGVASPKSSFNRNNNNNNNNLSFTGSASSSVCAEMARDTPATAMSSTSAVTTASSRRPNLLSTSSTSSTSSSGSASAMAAVVAEERRGGAGPLSAKNFHAVIATGRVVEATNVTANNVAAAAAAAAVDPRMPYTDILQDRIIELQQHYVIQQQVLHQQFKEQERKLVELQQQQQQMQTMRVSNIWQQKQIKEQQQKEQQQKEKERLEGMRKKENKIPHGAIASPNVRMKLAHFLTNKKKLQEQAAANNGTSHAQSNTDHKNWQQDIVSTSLVNVSVVNPYGLQTMQREKLEMQLRKSASEPNILNNVRGTLKARIEKKMTNVRHSPMNRRKEPHQPLWKTSLTNSGSNSDSGPNSPPTLGNSRFSPTISAGSCNSIQEEGRVATSSYGQLNSGSSSAVPQISPTDYPLFSSPSMPNISVSKSQLQSGSARTPTLAPVSEAEVRAAYTARFGGPLTGQILPDTLPSYPSISLAEGETIYLPQGHVVSMSGATPTARLSQSFLYRLPITDAQVAHTRLNRTSHRPLARTQSAPLPLKHPALTGMVMGPPPPATGHPYEDYRVVTRSLDESKPSHMRVKEHVRNTVLIRAGSRSQLLDDSPLESEESEVIDLTGRKDHPRSVQTVATDTHAQSKPEQTITTGLIYDAIMLKHGCTCGEAVRNHPEHGGRLQSIWARLSETGLMARCNRIRGRKATFGELKSCHDEDHAFQFGTTLAPRQKMDGIGINFVRLGCGGIGVDSDTTWSDMHTSAAAIMAAGCVIELASKTAKGEVRNGFAVVRPPGHHAEPNQAMGFCFFNNVAIAAKQLLVRGEAKRVLIVDWDVHHGNGTQKIFLDDPNVLYLSIHRYDDGNFFPGTGGPTECGVGEGTGYNVNIAWSGGLNPPMSDAEYLAAFRTIVMPVARDFDPDVVLVSAGFDAASGHPAQLGGYHVSPACFGLMTQMLMTLANGKVVLALEGGYDLATICDSAQECVRALLGDKTMPICEQELLRLPCQNAIDTLQRTIAIQLSHWPCLNEFSHMIGMSAAEARLIEETETLSAMASLSMRHQTSFSTTSEHSSIEEPMEQDEAK